MKTYASIDDYLAPLPPEQRAALETLRGQIRALAPEATETISYGLPTFKLDGNLVHFGAAAKHCAFYPGAVVAQFADRLDGFRPPRARSASSPTIPCRPS